VYGKRKVVGCVTEISPVRTWAGRAGIEETRTQTFSPGPGWASARVLLVREAGGRAARGVRPAGESVTSPP